MIEEMVTHLCDKCRSTDIHRNGRDKEDGRQKYYSKGCGHHGRLRDLQTPLSAEEARAQDSRKHRMEGVYRASFERASLRGLGRAFGVCREKVMDMLRKAAGKLKKLKEMVLPAEPGDVVEVDELWSFVGSKEKKCWIWTAICRRTRQIIAFAMGDRSARTARTLWRNIPNSYKKHAVFYSDFWEPYLKEFPNGCHDAVGKETGETAHMERWNNTLRQRLGRFTRKSLSFSKIHQHHYVHLRLFIHEYNMSTPVIK
jgi:insertion element IS1 protein InsB